MRSTNACTKDASGKPVYDWTIVDWVHHEVEKHGVDEVVSWYWEVWNEPDISYWHGSPDEYDKLNDYAAAVLKRALPRAKVGGPGSTATPFNAPGFISPTPSLPKPVDNLPVLVFSA